jgi:hypothetical protein
VPGSPARRLVAFVVALVCIGAVLEGACRHWHALFRAASHRSLFKAALLEQRLPQDIVFFGTSRTGEALRPHPFLQELSADGAPPLTAFNVSTPFSSLEILQYVGDHFASAPGLKLAVVEITRQQLGRRPLPWASAHAAEIDFDGRTISWLETHSSLVAERKVFVLNSLSRLGLIVLFGSMFDGTEEMGTDYFAAILGHSHDFDPSQFRAASCVPRPVDAPPATLAQYVEERDIYASIAADFAKNGVKVAFFVPPSMDPAHAAENEAPYRTLRAAIHAATGRPVWDFAACRLPPDYFRDPTHMSHLGGSHLSHFVAQAAAEDPEIAAALGLHRVTREANVIP